MQDYIKKELFCLNYYEYTFNNIDNHTLSEEILEQQIRMSDNPDICLFEDTEFVPKKGSVGESVYNMFVDIFEKKDRKIVKHWTQIHQPLESTSLHDHYGCTWGFVYYVKVPKGAGNLVFELEKMTSIIQPCEGKMLIFPAWLKHKVSKNMSNDIRISWAGNLC